MLKKHRVAEAHRELSDAVDIARAMLDHNHVDAAHDLLAAVVNNAGLDLMRATTDPDDYPPQHRAQFEAVAAEVRRIAPNCGAEVEEAKMSVVGRRDSATWAAHLVLTEDGVDADSWSPDHGPISHSGGRVPPNEAPEKTARDLLKAAGVQVPKA